MNEKIIKYEWKECWIGLKQEDLDPVAQSKPGDWPQDSAK